VSGLVEQWHKWGFPLTQDVSIPKPDAGWIAVKKQRRLRCYRVTADRQVKVMSAQAEPTQGCELELSRIEAAGQRWWSICFEAFGAEANLEEYLRRPVQHVLGLAEPPRLEKEHSFGYPHWLKTVAG
jgi:hypothetical protein